MKLPAHAATISYTDQVAFAAAVNAMTTIDFEGIASANSFKDYSTSTGLLISGVRFTGFENTSSYDLQVVDSGLSSPYNYFGSGASLRSPNYSTATSIIPYINIMLPVNTTAFGVDLMTRSPNALTYQVDVAGTHFNVATANRPVRTFFGVTSDVPISSINLSVLGTTMSGGTYGLVDNVRFGSADPPQTAEGCTLVLIGSGLAALGFFRKRLQAATAA